MLLAAPNQNAFKGLLQQAACQLKSCTCVCCRACSCTSLSSSCKALDSKNPRKYTTSPGLDMHSYKKMHSVAYSSIASCAVLHRRATQTLPSSQGKGSSRATLTRPRGDWPQETKSLVVCLVTSGGQPEVQAACHSVKSRHVT